MRLTLYRNESDNKQVVKNLLEAHTVEGVVKDGCSIVHPTFTLNLGSLTSVYKSNYLYWGEVGRYYYIDDIVYGLGKVVELRCSVDVLMSYSQYIGDLVTVVERQENIYNPYLEDKGICVTQGSIIKAIDVGQVGDETYTCYMTAIGSVESSGDGGE